MLPVHAEMSRRATEAHSRSALPDAPVRAPQELAPRARTRRLAADALIALADRVSPEPVQRSRWQSG
jgi:hypothetical protein